jgi:hypothetical protein
MASCIQEALLPLVLLYAHPAGSIVALFLALAAIQFVVDSDVPSSSYVTPLQQLTLASYLSLILVGLECVVIWW